MTIGYSCKAEEILTHLKAVLFTPTQGPVCIKNTSLAVPKYQINSCTVGRVLYGNLINKAENQYQETIILFFESNGYRQPSARESYCWLPELVHAVKDPPLPRVPPRQGKCNHLQSCKRHWHCHEGDYLPTQSADTQGPVPKMHCGT